MHGELFPPILIRASAGSGKTTELTKRYIELLLHGVSPEKILATTFTRKAAGEIQERLFLRLAKAALSNEAVPDKAFPELTRAAASKLLLALIGNQHRLNVGTLDSFFFQIASLFTFELGLSPDWKIADTFLNTQILQRGISALYREDREAAHKLFQSMYYGESKRAVHAQLMFDLLEMYDVYRESAGEAWNWLEPPNRLKKEALSTLLAKLKEIPIPLTAKQTPNKLWSAALPKLAEQVEQARWGELILGGPIKALLERAKGFSSVSFEESHLEVFNPLVQHVRAELLDRLRYQVSAFRELMELFERHYDAERDATKSLGFSDVKFKLLRETDSHSLNELYYRLDARLSHLLLDEFQDTSTTQWRILEPLVDELLSKSGEGEFSFFCVGDIKQAIYGWRGGNARIFEVLKSRWDQIISEDRERTYRCSPAVVQLVNKVFSDISQNPAMANFVDAASEWQTAFPMHIAHSGEKPGYASLIELPTSDEEDFEAQYYPQVTACVKQLLSEAPHATIGVLARRNSVVSRLMYEFSHPEIGVEASEEGGSTITDSAAVTTILSLLLALDHPGDMVARYHVASSPLGKLIGFSNFRDNDTLERLSQELREEISLHGLGTKIDAWVRALLPECGPRDKRRLGQLIALAYQFDEARGTRLAEFVRMVEQTRLENAGASRVRVMTIHQAKGLEFDIVVLPELHGDFIQYARSGLLVKRENDVGAPIAVSRVVRREITMLDPLLEEMYELERSERAKESLSLLYVAVTRAAHALHILIPSTLRSGPSHARILKQALCHEGAEEGVLAEFGRRDWAATVSAPSAKAPALQPVSKTKLSEVLIASPKTRRLKRRSPSLMHVAENPFLIQPGRVQARVRGKTLHALCEAVSWIDDGIPAAEDLLTSLEFYGISSDGSEDFIASFIAALKSKEVESIFSRERYGGLSSTIHLFREQDFAYRQGDELISGRFDRLVCCGSPGAYQSAEVIDFKTDILPSGEAVENRVELYRPQIESYKEAAAYLTSLKPESIKAAVVFLNYNRVIAL